MIHLVGARLTPPQLTPSRVLPVLSAKKKTPGSVPGAERDAASEAQERDPAPGRLGALPNRERGQERFLHRHGTSVLL